MNMDQVVVCVFTDRYKKTRIIDCDDIWEMLTQETPLGKVLYDADDLGDLFGGADWDRFNYITINQMILNGDFTDWEDLSKLFNHHWANRSSDNNYHDSRADDRGIFGFVNAGVLDHTLFNRWTFTPDPEDHRGAPTDFKIWLEARKNNYVQKSSLEEAAEKLKAKVEEKTPTKKVWLL